MVNYSKRYINAISLIFSIPIIIIILIINQIDIKNASILKFLNNNIIEIEMKTESINESAKEKLQDTKDAPENKILLDKNNQNNLNIQNKKESEVWQLNIPSISLIAPIAEGTTKEIMDNFIGHFEKTNKTEGNIGLAAHNRGYKVNYFQNLKKLKKGDEIIYRYKNLERKYKVTKHKIIKDTDWSCLENTKENTITLITCVEDEPEFRRCIFGVEDV